MERYEVVYSITGSVLIPAESAGQAKQQFQLRAKESELVKASEYVTWMMRVIGAH